MWQIVFTETKYKKEKNRTKQSKTGYIRNHDYVSDYFITLNSL